MLVGWQKQKQLKKINKNFCRNNIKALIHVDNAAIMNKKIKINEENVKKSRFIYLPNDKIIQFMAHFDKVH